MPILQGLNKGLGDLSRGLARGSGQWPQMFAQQQQMAYQQQQDEQERIRLEQEALRHKIESTISLGIKTNNQGMTEEALRQGIGFGFYPQGISTDLSESFQPDKSKWRQLQGMPGWMINDDILDEYGSPLREHASGDGPSVGQPHHPELVRRGAPAHQEVASLVIHDED